MIQYQILRANIIRIVQQTVRRITDEILGVEVLISRQRDSYLSPGEGGGVIFRRILIFHNKTYLIPPHWQSIFFYYKPPFILCQRRLIPPRTIMSLLSFFSCLFKNWSNFIGLWRSCGGEHQTSFSKESSPWQVIMATSVLKNHRISLLLRVIQQPAVSQVVT